MCNRITQNRVEAWPGKTLVVILPDTDGEFRLRLAEAVFGGAVGEEHRDVCVAEEKAIGVLIPEVTSYQVADMRTGGQSLQKLPAGSSLHGLIWPAAEGEEFRLVKVVTKIAGEFASKTLGTSRIPIVETPLIWNRVDKYNDEYPPQNTWVWTTDFQSVRKGCWDWGGPGQPLEEGKWEDEKGNPLTVM